MMHSLQRDSFSIHRYLRIIKMAQCVPNLHIFPRFLCIFLLFYRSQVRCGFGACYSVIIISEGSCFYGMNQKINKPFFQGLPTYVPPISEQQQRRGLSACMPNVIIVSSAFMQSRAPIGVNFGFHL